MSARGVTVSTVGLVPRIRDLAGEGLPVTLAISLHAPDDQLRDTLVPVNTRWKVGEVLDAAWEFAERTHRRVSIEYALIRDVNDQAWRAELLADLLVGHLVHVNLIPLNPTPGLEVDGIARRGREGLRARARATRRAGDRARHPWPRDRRGLRPTRGSHAVVTGGRWQTPPMTISSLGGIPEDDGNPSLPVSTHRQAPAAPRLHSRPPCGSWSASCSSSG